MKRIILVFLLAALSLVSCKKDPWKAIEAGDWNHERSILSIKFEGQAGVAVITNTDETTGTIDLSLSTDYVKDFSKVKLESLVLSYKAEGSVSTGDYVNFTGA